MSVTRTTVNAVQNFAAVESYRAIGEDVSDSYRFIAVRDARTSAICRALDGQGVRNDDDTASARRCTSGCRTSVVPIVNDAFLSKREQKTQPLTFGSYGSWLREQTSSQQDSILGATRADLWRNGRMTLADAVDSDNRVLTLEQLRQRLGIAARASPRTRGRSDCYPPHSSSRDSESRHQRD
jgi:SPP1 gp7 family putative phage head morphogenesis protein